MTMQMRRRRRHMPRRCRGERANPSCEMPCVGSKRAAPALQWGKLLRSRKLLRTCVRKKPRWGRGRGGRSGRCNGSLPSRPCSRPPAAVARRTLRLPVRLRIRVLFRQWRIPADPRSRPLRRVRRRHRPQSPRRLRRSPPRRTNSGSRGLRTSSEARCRRASYDSRTTFSTRRPARSSARCRPEILTFARGRLALHRDG